MTIFRATATRAILRAPGGVAVAGGDAFEVRPQLGAVRLALRGLDGRPAHEAAALLGDRAAVHRRVRLAVAGREPAPARELVGGAEAGDVADLGHEDRREHRPDAGDRLDRQVAEVAGEEAVQLGLGVADLVVEGARSAPAATRRGCGRRRRARQLSSSSLPATPNRSVIGTCTPSLASTRVDLQLEFVRRQTSLARWRTISRSSRTAGGAIQASARRPSRKQVGEVLGVAGVVLHPPVAPVVAERVGEVDIAAELLEQVGRPVPAVGRPRAPPRGARRRPSPPAAKAAQVVVVDPASPRASRPRRCAARSRCGGGAGRYRRTLVAVPQGASSVERVLVGKPRVCQHSVPRDGARPHLGPSASPSSSAATISPQPGQHPPVPTLRQNTLHSGQRRSSTKRSSQLGHS